MTAPHLHLRRIIIAGSASMMGVWFAVTLHLTWAGLLFVSDEPKHVTGLFLLSRLFPAKTGLAIILLTVAGCATFGLVKPHAHTGTRIALLVPQQLVLGVSAAGAIRAMWLQHYADGTIRSQDFLIADQMPQVLALLVHSATIVYLALARRWE